MKRTSEIPWFNPRQMDEATVLALNTGRDKLLAEFYEAVRKRQDAPQAGGHWLLTGPRGSGKSFFLRLVQTTFRRMIGDSATFVLLPEELPNVFSPVEWLREVERMLPGNSGDIGKSPTWQTKDDTDAWESALTSLLAAFTGKLLVIGVENFDKVLELAFDSEVRASRLRKLMENEPRIMLLATAVEGDFDEDYEQRMFRQFEHHVVPRWTPPDHRHYLSRRAQLVGKVATRNQLARIDAYSRFTGGSARIAAVMAGAILDEQDPLNASSNLTATLDRMSDYYRSLHEKMPVNTRKVFDALIRGGEPASQVEIAARVEARQNDISRAFGWLVDHGYVIDEREPGRKESRYRVADRLFVQFFRMRYLAPDQPSRLSILADLLSETIEFGQKWNFAEGYLAQGHSPEARTMAELACAERGVDLSLMPEDSKSVELLVEMGKTWRFLESMKHDVSLNYERFFSRYETDEQFHAAIKHTHDLASAKKRGNLVGRKYADIADRSVFASPLVRMILFALVLNPEFSDEQGAAVSELFEQERKLLNKLAALDPDGLKSLTVSSETARRFPLASSLTTVTETGTANGVGNGPQLAPQKIASWSARAAILWFGHKRTEDAIKSLATCWKALIELIENTGEADEAHRILQTLQPFTDAMPEDNCLMFYELLGRSLQSLDLHTEAVTAFNNAVPLATEPSACAFLQERLGWSLGASNQIEPAIRAHQLAKTERQNLGDTNNVAWNLGQIARHTARLRSLEDAWLILDETEALPPDEQAWAVSQLGDAVFDTAQLDGEAKAFAFARELLDGIAKRPRYISTLAVRRLWISMVETGVPLRLLDDLLNELPVIFAPSHQDMTALESLLRTWICDLQSSPEDRIKTQSKLEPDLAATLKSLGESLTPKAKKRYNFTFTPSRPEAA